MWWNRMGASVQSACALFDCVVWDVIWGCRSKSSCIPCVCHVWRNKSWLLDKRASALLYVQHASVCASMHNMRMCFYALYVHVLLCTTCICASMYNLRLCFYAQRTSELLYALSESSSTWLVHRSLGTYSIFTLLHSRSHSSYLYSSSQRNTVPDLFIVTVPYTPTWQAHRISRTLSVQFHMPPSSCS